MKIETWDKLTDRQKMIRLSIQAFYLVNCGVNPHVYVNLEGWK
jgi:hypothetical protein